LGVPEDSFSGTLELLTTDETIDSLAIKDKMPKGVHIIPSRTQLSELELVLSKYKDRTQILDRPILQARELYDFIFLDTEPQAAAITTVAAYSCAEWFLLSAFPHPLSLGGLTQAFNDIADVRKHRNPHLALLSPGCNFWAMPDRRSSEQSCWFLSSRLCVGQDSPDSKADKTSQTLAEATRIAEIAGEWREPILDALREHCDIVFGKMQLGMRKLGVGSLAREE